MFDRRLRFYEVYEQTSKRANEQTSKRANEQTKKRESKADERRVEKKIIKRKAKTHAIIPLNPIPSHQITLDRYRNTSNKPNTES
ncbi:hypothetical protein EYC80_009178 [Monilinia laxa]|uniref:Uncharacterized protein n=1 Tax=Monilinia laxa TaxID=61186 RepID=A0A5N6K2T1_MONLA|nr:hypothetical protein EYC80_009178 [Monilinia laxa]